MSDVSAAPSLARPRRVRVFLADDHRFFRDGLARAISRHDGLEVVGEAGNGLAALKLIQQLAPDVALLDVKMPGLDGIQVCARIRTPPPPPRTRVVLLSAYLDPNVVLRAALSGAAGYLSKETSYNDICDALIDVSLGGTAFSPEAEGGVLAKLEGNYGLVSPDRTDA